MAAAVQLQPAVQLIFWKDTSLIAISHASLKHLRVKRGHLNCVLILNGWIGAASLLVKSDARGRHKETTPRINMHTHTAAFSLPSHNGAHNPGRDAITCCLCVCVYSDKKALGSSMREKRMHEKIRTHSARREKEGEGKDCKESGWSCCVSRNADHR